MPCAIKTFQVPASLKSEILKQSQNFSALLKITPELSTSIHNFNSSLFQLNTSLQNQNYPALVDKIQQLSTKINNTQECKCMSNTSLENKTRNDSMHINNCSSLPPSSLSGYYWVRAPNGSDVRVYCDMTRLCGNVSGGWMRMAYLDMTDSRRDD